MRFKISLIILGTAVALGCSSANSRLTTCQAEKDQLLTTIRNQRDTTRTLNEQVASLETRLDQAEKQLAGGNSATRFSSLPSRSNPPTEKSPSDRSTPVKTDSLPWRSPGAKAEPAGPDLKPNTRASTNPSVARGSLVALSKKDRRVHYDATSRAAEIETPIQFDNNSSTLSAEGKHQLDDLSKLLRSDEARDLRIVVAGAGGRAQAVADYLDRHGIPDERLSVGSTKTAATAEPEKLSASGGVQVFLLDPEASVASWGAKPLRR
jgi:outer membrane protein OmpA-like peptidoglycan-associated protein